MTFTDLGHVLFTVEPWQGSTSGCEDSPVGAPNSQLIDSTDDTLSHELFETISDPDGTAWWNAADLSLYGNEMADECLAMLLPVMRGLRNRAIGHVDRAHDIVDNAERTARWE